MKQLDLFTYMLGQEGIYDPKMYAPGFEYMAFHNGDKTPIQAMNDYKEYILKEIKKAKTEEKRKQWENALASIERQIEDFKNDEQSIIHK